MSKFANLFSILTLFIALNWLAIVQSIAQTKCVAPANWVSHNSVPEPDHSRAPTALCDFSLWAWNTFLWITDADEIGEPRFMSFATLEELFDQSATLKLYAGLPLVKNTVFNARTSKAGSNTVANVVQNDSISVLQARSRGVLIHPSIGHPTAGRAIYYSQNVNRTYYDFVRRNNYHIRENYIQSPADKSFPIGALEFKYAWKVVEEGEDASGFFTTSAKVAALVSDSQAGVVTDPNKVLDVTLALVGVHVVGVVKNHPEFIWATFEHRDNAPNLPDGMAVDSMQKVSDKNFTFYRAGTAAKNSNVNNRNKVEFESEAAQLVTPIVDVFRQFAWGADPSEPSDQFFAAEIQSLNKSVENQVLHLNDIWKNYRLIGAVWGDANSLEPNMRVDPRGSTKLSNSTMETFTQNRASTAHCLSCHTTKRASAEIGPKNLNISHILKGRFRMP